MQICLLVTDDPDDHHAFSEAISDISDHAIVLIILDSQKAIDLLKARNRLPDYIFLDLSMHGIRINSFIKIIKQNSELSKVPTVVYGDDESFSKIDNGSDLHFFDKEYEYSALKTFLRGFIKSEDDT